MENKEYNFAYKAPTEAERREIEAIKRQYEPPKTEDGRLERLRKLNAYVNNVAIIVSLTVGIIGILIFGLGISMVLEWEAVIGGIIVAVFGIPPIAMAYPLYSFVLRRNKAKYGEEILRLSEELLNESIN